MQKTKRGCRLLAVLLSLIMLLGLLPMSALAADGEITILLSYFNADEDGFPIARQPVTVAPSLSEAYGYTDVYYGAAVTALDAIVAAHVAVFGDNPTTISSNLAVSNTGFISNFMGIGYDFVYFVNGEMVGAGPSLIRLGDGDVVELVAMQDTNMSSDAYIWFELAGSRIDKITVGTDEAFTLTLAGIDWAMWGDWGAFPAEFDENAIVIDMLMDTPSSAEWNGLVIKEKSDDYGDVDIEFNIPGTYYLTAIGMTYLYDSPLMGTWLEVEVTVGGPAIPVATPVIVNTPPGPDSPGEPSATWNTALDNTLNYLATIQSPAPVYGAEWEILALARGGYPVPTDYFEGYFESVKAMLAAQNTNKPRESSGAVNTPTTNAKLVLALTAIGVDATDVGGFDLLAPLTDLAYLKNQGLNAAAYALLAMDSKPYTVNQDIKDDIIAYILSEELASGGFNQWGSEAASPDDTGMVLQALAPYKTDGNIAAVIDRALTELEKIQEFGGGYESWGSVSVENSAPVIVAAAALGMDPAVDLVKDKAAVSMGYDGAGNDNPLYSMLRFYMDTGAGIGGFQSSWMLGSVSVMSTQQGGYALVAYDRYKKGMNSLYDMSDCDITLGELSGLNTFLLEALIEKAESLTQTDYTAMSWSAMAAKLSAANAVLIDPASTQVGINQAASELNAAINALIKDSGSGSGSTNISVTVYVKVPPQSRTSEHTYKNNASAYSDLFAPVTVSIPTGSTALFALYVALMERGVSYIESGGYFAAIGSWEHMNPFPGSGWMFMVGSIVPTVGSDEYFLNANATMTWFFTDDMASEYGSENWSSGGGGGGGGGAAAGAATTTTVIEVAPTVNGDTAAAAVTPEQIEDALKAVLDDLEGKGSNAIGEITIKNDTGSAPEAKTTIAQEALASVAGNKNVILTVDTGVATMTFDNAALAETLKGAGNAQEVTFTMTKVPDTELTEEQKQAAGGNPVFEFTVTAGTQNITNFGSGTVTVSLPYTPPAGMAAADYDLLAVYYLDADGNVKEMPGAKYDPKTGLITFTTNHFSHFFVSEWVNPFRDVARSAWYYKEVRFAYGRELILGTSAATFSPQQTFTRAMLITILARQEGKAGNSSGDGWYKDALAWAVAAGITDGNDPTGLIPREEFALIMYNYAKYKGLDTPVGGYVAAYSDVDSVSPWAVDAMKWANAQGLITGRTTTTLDPLGTTTRAEAATILMRFLEAMAP